MEDEENKAQQELYDLEQQKDEQMGYQVGNQCFSEQKEAENFYFSQIVPTIGPDGKLYQPTFFKSQGWIYQGQKLQIYLPECSPEQNFKDGLELGFLFLGVAIVAWCGMYLGKLMSKWR